MVTVTVNSIVPGDPGDGIDKTQSALIVEGSLVLSGSYGFGSPVLPGDIIDFRNARITSSRAPRRVEIFQVPDAGDDPVAYTFLYGQGSGPSDGVLIVQDFAGAGLAAGAYPAALTDDDPSPNIRFRATFPLFI